MGLGALFAKLEPIVKVYARDQTRKPVDVSRRLNAEGHKTADGAVWTPRLDVSAPLAGDFFVVKFDRLYAEIRQCLIKHLAGGARTEKFQGVLDRDTAAAVRANRIHAVDEVNENLPIYCRQDAADPRKQDAFRDARQTFLIEMIVRIEAIFYHGILSTSDSGRRRRVGAL